MKWRKGEAEVSAEYVCAATKNSKMVWNSKKREAYGRYSVVALRLSFADIEYFNAVSSTVADTPVHQVYRVS